MYVEAKRVIESSKNLFHFAKIHDVLDNEIANSDTQKALYIILIAAFLTALINVLGVAELMYIAAFEYNVLAEIASAEKADVEWVDLVPFALSQFILFVPFVVVFSLVYEKITYHLMHLIGGVGQFKQQYYISSIIALSMAIAYLVVLLGPIPLIQLVAAVALVTMILYFDFYVNVLVYDSIHKISFFHAFAIVALLALPRLVIMVLAVNWASELFGLPAPIVLLG